VIGVPIPLHYCKMMRQKTISSCDMCKAEIEKNGTSCCNDDAQEYSVTISADTPLCCQDQFVINKVEDHFIFNKPDIIFFSSIEKLFHSITIISPSKDYSLQESFYCDSSPPFLINPEINITNSILLI
jgi:hypothetical protein